MQALILAAGMGKRLNTYTNDNTKCMVEVAGKKLIDRTIEAIELAGIKKIIIVVGYKAENLITYLRQNYQNSPIKFEFINNPDYDKSNNIYSLYLAKNLAQADDTILLESDLIYDKALIKDIIADPHENLAVIAKHQAWMDGTVVTCHDFAQAKHGGFISEFISKEEINSRDMDRYYKTVNIYKFSKDFNRDIYFPLLADFIKTHGLNNYYEAALKAVTEMSKSQLFGYEIGNLPWYEIDNTQDLYVANNLFTATQGNKD